MTIVKTKFRPSTVAGKEGTLYYRVTHGQMSRQISTGYKLYPNEWENDWLKTPSADENPARNHYLFGLEKRLNKDMARIKEIIRQMDLSGKKYTAEQVVDAYLMPDHDEKKLCVFVRCLTKQLRHIGKERLAETYTTSTNSFMRFLEGQNDLHFTEIDSNLMRDYEAYLKRQGLVPNTISFYMRNLRAIYHRAVEKGLTENRQPFRHVYTGIEKTAKRAVAASVIQKIKDLDLSQAPSLERARDFFLFSFYTRGMPFIDMAHLKKTDLQGGTLSYRRKKTAQALFIRWEYPMQEIISRYRHSDSPYLLPILAASDKGERLQYLNALHAMNRHLKTIGKKAGCPIPLSTYVARHGWASIARNEHIPISTISEALGHESESTTRIYLASLDTSVVDEANRKVIRAILKKH